MSHSGLRASPMSVAVCPSLGSSAVCHSSTEGSASTSFTSDTRLASGISRRSLSHRSTGVCSISRMDEVAHGCPSALQSVQRITHRQRESLVKEHKPLLCHLEELQFHFSISTSTRKLQLKAASAVGSQGVCAHHY